MVERACCARARGPAGSKARGVVAMTKWVVPAAVLAVLPKCPMCVAGYLAVATGFSVSLSVATWVRTGLIVACVGALAWSAVGVVRRALGRATAGR